MLSVGTPEIYRVADESPVTWADAMNAWERPATELLIETAKTYHDTLSAPTLAEHVQESSQVRTTVPSNKWMPRLLERVAKKAVLDRQPPLTALCVDSDGSIYDGYASWIRLPGQEVPVTSADIHAAQDRLQCYRVFAVDLPDDGGEPGPMPRVLVANAPGQSARSNSGAGRTRGSGSRVSSTSSRTRATTGKPPRRISAEKASRIAADEPAKICPSCFTQLPASGICDYCGA